MAHTDNERHTTTTVVIFPATRTAVAKVRPIPGYRRWTCPPAATIRKLVDAAIAESGYPSWRRVSRAVSADTDTGWNIRFKLDD